MPDPTEPARTRYLIVVDVDHGEGHPPPHSAVVATVARRTTGLVLNDSSGHQIPRRWGVLPSIVAVSEPLTGPAVDPLPLQRVVVAAPPPLEDGAGIGPLLARLSSLMRPLPSTVPEPDAEGLCSEAFYRCRCSLPAGHDGDVHECGGICGGSWRPDPTDEDGVEIVSLPSGVPAGGPPRSDVGNPYATTGVLDPAGEGALSITRGAIVYPTPPPAGGTFLEKLDEAGLLPTSDHIVWPAWPRPDEDDPSPSEPNPS